MNSSLSTKSNNYVRSVITLGDKNSFAVEDLKSQAQRVIKLIISNNKLTDLKIDNLLKIRKSVLENNVIPYLQFGEGITYWHQIMQIDKNRRWFGDYHHGLTISYFYRLILDRLNYFDSLNDPFAQIKLNMFLKFLESPKNQIKHDLKIDELLLSMLWGNKADLVPPKIGVYKTLLVDDRKIFIEFLKHSKLSTVDILADNTGEELVYDLIFVEYLLSNGLAKLIRYHVKNYPYNITDTTRDDFFTIVSILRRKNSRFKKLADSISKFISDGSIQVVTYPYTTLGLDRSKAINIIEKQYAKSSLIITKGDFNYRKNVGWYFWRKSDNYNLVVSYLKTPILCFRTIKNEIMLGIKDQLRITSLNQKDPDWWKKGVGGVIMFSIPQKNSQTYTENLPEYWGQNE